jgi:predicted DNA-binding transcriptional regulator AlpA
MVVALYGVRTMAKTFLRLKQVMARTGLPASSIYEGMGKGWFPKNFTLEGNRVAWDDDQITDWQVARLAACATVRGYTFAAVLCDELAFWRSDDSANPDDEIISAVRPGMLTIPNAMLLCASSPYARRGALWDAHQTYFGKDDPEVLVWQAATTVMNPTVPQSYIDKKGRGPARRRRRVSRAVSYRR